MLTVATDSAEMYGSEVVKAKQRYFGNRFDAVAAGETWGRYLAGAGVDYVQELSHVDRKRIFNLGYFTWVEQQGVSLEDFSSAPTGVLGRAARSRAGLGRNDRGVQRGERRRRPAP